MYSVSGLFVPGALLGLGQKRTQLLVPRGRPYPPFRGDFSVVPQLHCERLFACQVHAFSFTGEVLIFCLRDPGGFRSRGAHPTGEFPIDFSVFPRLPPRRLVSCRVHAFCLLLDRYKFRYFISGTHAVFCPAELSLPARV